MRVILDANILLSALLSPLGAPAKILEAWERKLFALIACEELLIELRDVSTRPFFRARLRAGAAEVLAISIQDLSVFCEDLPSGVEAPDLKDSYLLALAEAGQAQYLVTGDKELLELGSHKATKIISARDFAALFDLNAAP
jgi:putative PIN family toxin of toxin-antitoxin system